MRRTTLSCRDFLWSSSTLSVSSDGPLSSIIVGDLSLEELDPATRGTSGASAFSPCYF